MVGPRILYRPYLPAPVPRTSRRTYHVSPGFAPLFLLGFVPLAIFILQNIKYCCLVSLYFPRLLPFNNSYARLFSPPPPVHLPLHISYPVISEPSYCPIAGKLHQVSWKPLSQFKEPFNYGISLMP